MANQGHTQTMHQLVVQLVNYCPVVQPVMYQARNDVRTCTLDEKLLKCKRKTVELCKLSICGLRVYFT